MCDYDQSIWDNGSLAQSSVPVQLGPSLIFGINIKPHPGPGPWYSTAIAALHGIADEKPNQNYFPSEKSGTTKVMEDVIESKAMTTDCGTNFPIDKAWQRLRPQKCVFWCGVRQNFWHAGKKGRGGRVIVIGRNSRQTSLSEFDLREPGVVIYLCLQNMMNGSVWRWWFWGFFLTYKSISLTFL